MVAGGASGGGGGPPGIGGSDLELIRLRLRVSGTGEISCLIVFSASSGNVDIHTT